MIVMYFLIKKYIIHSSSKMNFGSAFVERCR
jgi:hypothetical protein